MDQHRLDADPDPDPTFHLDVDPHPGPDPIPKTLRMLENHKYIFLTYGYRSFHCLYLSRQRHRYHKFQYLYSNSVL
jgi:hypothetical protein